MKRIFQFAAIVVLTSLVALGTTSAFAQTPEKSPQATADAVEHAWQKRMKEFTCDSLPLSEVVKMLQAEFPEINFVVTPEASDAVVPRLQLRAVTLEEIFTAIQFATHGQIQAQRQSEKMVTLTFGEGEARVKPKKVCRAFSLSNYLNQYPADKTDAAVKDVELALDHCWQMLEDANAVDSSQTGNIPAPAGRPHLSLHRETKLLIVVGDPEQLDVVEQVVGEIERGAMNKTASPWASPGIPAPQLRQTPARTVRPLPSVALPPPAPVSPSPTVPSPGK